MKLFRKVVLLLILSFAFPLAASPFSVSFFTPQRPDFRLTQSFEYNFLNSYTKDENTGLSTKVTMDARELFAQCGIHANSKNTDAALQLYYGPSFWNLVSLGASAKYHFCKYSDLYAEHNLLLGGFISFNIAGVWLLYTNIGYAGKYTIINSYPDIHMTENNLFFRTGFLFTPSCQGGAWKFSFDASSFTLFDDGILGDFTFQLGFMRHIWERFYAGCDLYGKWLDASVFCDSFCQYGLRMNWEVKL